MAHTRWSKDQSIIILSLRNNILRSRFPVVLTLTQQRKSYITLWKHTRDIIRWRLVIILLGGFPWYLHFLLVGAILRLCRSNDGTVIHQMTLKPLIRYFIHLVKR